MKHPKILAKPRIIPQLRQLEEVVKTKERENPNPQEETETRIKILQLFDWTDTLLREVENEAIEVILVDHHDLLRENGYWDEHRIPSYTHARGRQSCLQPKPTNADPKPSKEDLVVELALMHKYGNIRVLHFSKYATPLLARRKTNGKLLLLVDLQNINSLIANDHANTNHPVNTLSDAA